jgi:flagellar biosynthesis anti-sigma factor FlgM
MPYPIQNTNPTEVVDATSLAADPPTVASASSSPPGPGPDSVDVSKTAALLISIAEAASNTPAIDQARVADLLQAISSGTVGANPQQIAKSIAELEALLASTGGGQ